eukprot:CAMPEP_0203824154 /NCGR_PEP_ID=MMETSP0115-20131106/51101_1 /ASSEMBLY_ACC=CAM_ASM_000227 /TAXON_ID=33651 /ORGANISM="Bicosoecid sp, Strain ms1" /LENGTH=46 /DNA_ID= /DNA_START= /DNA_END= /DNA_ORIENTATION=
MADESKAAVDDVAKHRLEADAEKKGAYVRPDTKFHNRIGGDGDFPA